VIVTLPLLGMPLASWSIIYPSPPSSMKVILPMRKILVEVGLVCRRFRVHAAREEIDSHSHITEYYD
jgi:hypothetical protein